MIALFVGLRLYAVLGQRTGHEQSPVVTRPDAAPEAAPVAAAPDASQGPAEPSGLAYEQSAAIGIRAIIAADSSYDVARFIEGAQSAYKMVLEAFWKGDREELAAVEEAEIAVIVRFLPQQMSDDEARAAIGAIIAETGAASMKDMGKVMAEVKSRHATSIEPAKASALVKALLAGA